MRYKIKERKVYDLISVFKDYSEDTVATFKSKNIAKLFLKLFKKGE